ncbi:hypothetical protein V8Z80_08525 [Orrella sp. JC864]|uniref:hypothetical protein n=1 Tax=Orrella sp. JC864 TaxID=3120298 RepID=UPI00300A6C20
MVLLMKIWAAVTQRKIVALLHHDGEVSFHIARRTPFGMECKTLGRRCLLLKDGSVKGPSWVDAWEVA